MQFENHLNSNYRRDISVPAPRHQPPTPTKLAHPNQPQRHEERKERAEISSLFALFVSLRLKSTPPGICAADEDFEAYYKKNGNRLDTNFTNSHELISHFLIPEDS